MVSFVSTREVTRPMDIKLSTRTGRGGRDEAHQPVKLEVALSESPSWVPREGREPSHQLSVKQSRGEDY